MLNLHDTCALMQTGNRRLHEIEEDVYYYFLGVVPPLYIAVPDAFDRTFKGNIETFCAGECITGTEYNQFAICDGRFYWKRVDIESRVSMITRDLIERANNGETVESL